jgi:hypothetical protein
MKKKFSIAMSLSVISAMTFASLALAAQPAHVAFTADAPCAVSVLLDTYTDPTGLVVHTDNRSIPFTLDVFPSTTVTFFYTTLVACNGVTYHFVSSSPSNPLTSGAENSTTTVLGHYSSDITPPTIAVHADVTVEATSALGAIVSYTAPATSDAVDGAGIATCAPASGMQFALGDTTVNCDAVDVAGNHAAQTSFVVHVVDTIAPVIVSHGDVTVEAANALGAIVSYTSPATSDAVDGAGTATCAPASGTQFAPGDTTVKCDAADAAGNHAVQTSFVVHVVDTTPPSIIVPANIVAPATSPSGAVVGFFVSANDVVDGVITPICSPASGSTFPITTTTVNCSATDSHNNSANKSFTVTVVDNGLPVLTLPANMTVEAASASGAPVTFTASASDVVDGPLTATCLPASGSTFPLGITTVNCSATDSQNNTANGSFTVTVVDTTQPVLTLPADTTVAALDASGATVNFTVSANDTVDGSVAVTCLPVSGSVFAVGTTTVNCSATDSHNNTANGSFTVTVTLDTTPPVLTLPANMTVEAVNASGAPVNFTASASDAVDGPVAVACSPTSGSTFSFGTTTVNCSATDSHNNTASGSFTITVVDTTPPVLTLPANMVVMALNASGAPVNFTVSANDLVDGPMAVVCSSASGSWFPIGISTVNCSAADSHGNTVNGGFNVSVQYTSAGNNCKGVPGHQILQPINSDGSSVFNAGSTVPAKFRVCGADGDGIGTPGVVTNFRLIQIVSKDGTSNVDQVVTSTSSDPDFRSGNQQWIFNIDTKDLSVGNTYVYLISLNDGSAIQFQFALK